MEAPRATRRGRVVAPIVTIALLLATAALLARRALEENGPRMPAPASTSRMVRPPADAVDPGAAPATAPIDADPLEPRQQGVAITAVRSRSAPPSAAPRPRGPRTGTATPGEKVIEVQGRVVLLDAAGAELPPPTGRFDAFYWRSSYGEDDPGVAVVDGRFTLWPPEGTTLDVVDAEFDGRRAFVAEREIPLEPDRELRLVAHLWRPTRLIVLDRATRTPLEGVVVTKCEAPHARYGRVRDAGARDVTVARGDSPLELPFPDEIAARREQWLDVTAPGHATAKTRVDFAAGGDTTVLLASGGDLYVGLALPRIEEHPGMTLPYGVAIRRSDEAAWTPRIASIGVSRHAQFVGIESGRYEVALLPSDTLEGLEADEPPLAATQVEVRAGEVTTAKLVLDEDRRIVPVEGRVRVPPGWDASELTIRFEPVAAEGFSSRGALQLTVADAALAGGTTSPFATRLPRGRWRARSTLPYLDRTFETGPFGSFDVELVIDPPVVTEISFADGATSGPPVVEGTLSWHIAAPIDVARPLLAKVRVGSDGRAVVRAPPGELRLALLGPLGTLYALPVPGTLTLDARTERLTLTLARRAALRLTIIDADPATATRRDRSPSEPPPALDDLPAVKLRVARRDAPADAKRCTIESPGTLDVALAAPGMWRVTWDAVSGIEPPPAFDVEVGPGEFVERTIEVLRRR